MKNKNSLRSSFVTAVMAATLSGCASSHFQFWSSDAAEPEADQSSPSAQANEQTVQAAPVRTSTADADSVKQVQSAIVTEPAQNPDPVQKAKDSSIPASPEPQLASSTKKYGHLKAMQDIMALNPSVSSGQTVAAETVPVNQPVTLAKQAQTTETRGSAAAPKPSTAKQAVTSKEVDSQANVATKKIASAETPPSTGPADNTSKPVEQAELKPVKTADTQKDKATLAQTQAPTSQPQKLAVENVEDQTVASGASAILKQTTDTPKPIVKPHTLVAKSEPTPPSSPSEVEHNDDKEIAAIQAITETQPTAAGIAPQSVLLNSPNPMNPEKKILVTQAISMDSDGWLLETGWAAQPQKCRITTATFEINQNDYATQVWLDISDNQLAVVASSNIDIKKKGVGLKFDDNKLLAFTHNIFSNTAAINRDLSKLLLASNQLDIFLGGNEFKGTQQVSIPLQGLKDAFKEFQNCR